MRVAWDSICCAGRRGECACRARCVCGPREGACLPLFYCRSPRRCPARPARPRPDRPKPGPRNRGQRVGALAKALAGLWWQGGVGLTAFALRRGVLERRLVFVHAKPPSEVFFFPARARPPGGPTLKKKITHLLSPPFFSSDAMETCDCLSGEGLKSCYASFGVDVTRVRAFYAPVAALEKSWGGESAAHPLQPAPAAAAAAAAAAPSPRAAVASQDEDEYRGGGDGGGSPAPWWPLGLPPLWS